MSNYNKASYPSPKSQGAKQKMSVPSMEDTTKSEVIKAGVNIPNSVFFVHEDTAFMHMTNKVLGNIPQYVIRNILLVHNRKHPKKRSHVKGEEGIDKTNTGALRRAHNWYEKANKLCEQNCYNLFNPNFKSYFWNDVFK